jgi:ABC-type sugar transport system permease subunit
MPKKKIKTERHAYSGYLFLLPNLLGFLALTLLPVLASFGLSFVKWNIFGSMRFASMEFVGLGNFIDLLHNSDFWRYAGNTLFLMLGIPVGMLGALFLATIMNQKLKGIVLFRTMFFLPTITTGVALLILWKWIYNADYGLFNTVLKGIGITGPNWLGNPGWAKPAIMLMTFWTAVGGYNMILYLAALQGISPQLYEAADIDGADRWHKFWSITWPLVSPTSFFILTMSIIGGFQGGFQAAYIMTEGGPAGATTTISYYIFKNAYEWFHMGYAAAIALFLFLVVFVLTLFNWRFGGNKVVY